MLIAWNVMAQNTNNNVQSITVLSLTTGRLGLQKYINTVESEKYCMHNLFFKHQKVYWVSENCPGLE